MIMSLSACYNPSRRVECVEEMRCRSRVSRTKDYYYSQDVMTQKRELIAQWSLGPGTFSVFLFCKHHRMQSDKCCEYDALTEENCQ